MSLKRFSCAIGSVLTLNIVLATPFLPAQGLVQTQEYRVYSRTVCDIQGTEGETKPEIECLKTSLFALDRLKHDGNSKGISRFLCETPSGKYAIYRHFDASTGDLDVVVIDVDHKVWIRIENSPDVRPRQEGEDQWSFSKRLGDPAVDLIRVETSTRRFDPIHGEQIDQERPRIWKEICQADPVVAKMVENILKDFGSSSSPDWDVILHVFSKWIYENQEEDISSPELKCTRYKFVFEKVEQEHESTEFEENFGKFGTSFPDPPRLK